MWIEKVSSVQVSKWMETSEYTIHAGLNMLHSSLPLYYRGLLKFDSISTFPTHNCAPTCYKSIFHWDQPGATLKTLNRKHLITFSEGNWKEGCVFREAGQHLLKATGPLSDPKLFFQKASLMLEHCPAKNHRYIIY